MKYNWPGQSWKKKHITGGGKLPDVKIYYKAIVIKAEWWDGLKKKKKEQNRLQNQACM